MAAVISIGVAAAIQERRFRGMLVDVVIDPHEWSNDGAALVGREAAAAQELETRRAQLRKELDGRLFERDDLAWYRGACVEAFLFMYDTSFYDRGAGRYRIEEILDDGEREFGGYDFVLLWQSYPRLGIDGRNQLDLYRDMPGGLPGLRDLVQRAHDRDVRVFVNYNPWDVGTRREPDGRSDGEALAGVIAGIDADGVFLDTMTMDQPGFREDLERANPAILFNPEGVPPVTALSSVAGSWLQRRAVAPPGLITIRWLEPRFSFRAIDRTALDHRAILHKGFFHGCGQVVWENIFGWWNPWPEADRALLRRCVWILREHAAAFQDMGWQPYVSTLAEGVYAHRWQDGQTVVHTLLNDSGASVDRPILQVAARDDNGAALRHYDVWNGRELLATEASGGAAEFVSLSLAMAPGEAGCVVSAPEGVTVRFPPTDTSCEGRAGAPASSPRGVGGGAPRPTTRDRAYRDRVTVADHKPRPVAPTPPVEPGSAPPDMCRLPGGPLQMAVRHNVAAVMEGACYGSQEEHRSTYHPPQLFDLPPYWIDRTEVTNAQYREFLVNTHHVPAELHNFLRHWSRGDAAAAPWEWQMPAGKERHPVVWVDLDDARAYARWAGKRLPTEPEWHNASGRDLWPWGDLFDAGRCNGAGADTTPVDRFPQGASPCGCLDMSGNVWEWTESERDDGHARYAIVRGGSYLVVVGSKWYQASGAQPNDCHEKVLLMYPGLDRCATIGFRCVKDEG